MARHDIDQGSIVPIAIYYPAREPLVPNQVVAVYLLTVGDRDVDNGICSFPLEMILCRFCKIPLHGVLRGHGTEVGRVIENALLGLILADGQCGAEPFFPFRSYRRIEALSDLSCEHI